MRAARAPAAQSGVGGGPRRPFPCRRPLSVGGARAAAAAASSSSPSPRFAEPEPVVLYAGSSEHSPKIQVLEFPDTRQFPPQIRGGRVLYCDDSPNIHSVWHPPAPSAPAPAAATSAPPRATGAYYDVLAALPAFLRRPTGPLTDGGAAPPSTAPPEQAVVILGLGAGTCARLMQGAFPGWFPPGAGRMVGWELDAAVVDVSREYMGLAPLMDSGALVARVGDALAEPPADELGACAGVVVDLFSRGRLLPELREAETWCRAVGRRLSRVPGARAIVNLGAGPVAGMPVTAAVADALAALAALEEAFGEKAGGAGVCVAALRTRTTSNLIAMTGGVPTRAEVAAASALMGTLGAPEALRAAAAQTRWQDARAFAAAGAGGPGAPGGAARGAASSNAAPGMGPGRRPQYGGGPGMGMGGSGSGRMRF